MEFQDRQREARDRYFQHKISVYSSATKQVSDTYLCPVCLTGLETMSDQKIFQTGTIKAHLTSDQNFLLFNNPKNRLNDSLKEQRI